VVVIAGRSHKRGMTKWRRRISSFLASFLKDFVDPVPVISTESVLWENRAAGQALPWVDADENDDFTIPDEDDWNEYSDVS
jgi:hypothetical protein